MSLTIRMKKGKKINPDNEPAWVKLARTNSKTGDLPVYVHSSLMEYMRVFDVHGLDVSKKPLDQKEYIAIIPEDYNMNVIQTSLFEEEDKQEEFKPKLKMGAQTSLENLF